MKKFIFAILAIVCGLSTILTFTACSSDDEMDPNDSGQGGAEDVAYKLDSLITVSSSGAIVSKELYRYNQQGTLTEIEKINNTQNTHKLIFNESVDSKGRVLHQIIYDVSGGKRSMIQESTAEEKDGIFYESIDKVDDICTKTVTTYDKDGREKEKDVTYLADNGLYLPYYTVDFEYDDRGNVVSEFYSDKSDPDYHVDYHYEYEYDGKCQRDQYVSKTMYYLSEDGSKVFDNRSELKYDNQRNNIECYDYRASEFGKPLTLVGHSEYNVLTDVPSDKIKELTYKPWQPHTSTVTKNYNASGRLISTSTYYISKMK